MIPAEFDYTRPVGRIHELRIVRDDGTHPARALTRRALPATAGGRGNRR